MAHVRTQEATDADVKLYQIAAGTYPASAPKVDATGERWVIVADRMVYDPASTEYSEHGRRHVNSGKRV